MLATSGRRRPLGRTIVHVALVLALSFGVLAGAGGYWAVVRSDELVRSPYDAAVIAASRTVPRGKIVDRHGTTLARNEKDANGELYRVYRGTAASQVIGYASPQFGRAGWAATRSPPRCASSARTRTTRRTCNWPCRGICSGPPFGRSAIVGERSS
jgi:hypothetical protein